MHCDKCCSCKLNCGSDGDRLEVKTVKVQVAVGEELEESLRWMVGAVKFVETWCSLKTFWSRQCSRHKSGPGLFLESSFSWLVRRVISNGYYAVCVYTVGHSGVMSKWLPRNFGPPKMAPLCTTLGVCCRLLYTCQCMDGIGENRDASSNVAPVPSLWTDSKNKCKRQWEFLARNAKFV